MAKCPESFEFVLAGLVPAIHDLLAVRKVAAL